MKTLSDEKKTHHRWHFHRLLLLIILVLVLAGCGSSTSLPAAPTVPVISSPDGWHVLANLNDRDARTFVTNIADVTPTTTWRVLGSCSGKGTLSILQDGALL